MLQKRQNVLNGLRFSAETWAALALAFVLVAVKKWEPGDNLDCIWYAAVARNIFESGNFHHFQISPFFYPTVADHMPLTYWLTALDFKLFGPSDFIARLYPIVMSFFSYMFVYWIGSTVKDRFFGLCSILALALAYGFSKWNGALMHDVPLTTFFLATIFFFIKGQRASYFYLLSGIALALGVMTKGPIIGALILAFPLWLLWQRDFSLLREKKFYLLPLASVCVLVFFLLPIFQIDGQNPFLFFIEAKKSYLNTEQESLWRYFAYAEVLWTNGAPLLLLFIFSTYKLLSAPAKLSGEVQKFSHLFLLIVTCTVVPLSFFKVKFPHYMLPVYPFMALVSAPSLEVWLARYRMLAPLVVQRLAIAALVLLSFIPIPTSGGRSKTTLNIINLIKFDSKIASKRVAFLGAYNDDMSIFQSFKWYGGLDLIPFTKEDLDHFDLKTGYLIINVAKLPLQIQGITYDINSCVARNWEYCAITERSNVNFDMPAELLPHEVFLKGH